MVAEDYLPCMKRILEEDNVTKISIFTASVRDYADVMKTAFPTAEIRTHTHDFAQKEKHDEQNDIIAWVEWFTLSEADYVFLPMHSTFSLTAVSYGRSPVVVALPSCERLAYREPCSHFLFDGDNGDTYKSVLPSSYINPYCRQAIL